MARPHGTKYIETPEKMWELFEAYKKEVKANPIRKMVFVGKDGNRDYEDRERPLTMEGFECFVMNHTEINYPDLSSYFDGKNESYQDYFHICTRIKREIRQDQIDGGMVGIFNPSITQRLNGLVEKSENKTEHSGTINANFGSVIQPSQQSGSDSPSN